MFTGRRSATLVDALDIWLALDTEPSSKLICPPAWGGGVTCRCLLLRVVRAMALMLLPKPRPLYTTPPPPSGRLRAGPPIRVMYGSAPAGTRAWARDGHPAWP